MKTIVPNGNANLYIVKFVKDDDGKVIEFMEPIIAWLIVVKKTNSNNEVRAFKMPIGVNECGDSEEGYWVFDKSTEWWWSSTESGFDKESLINSYLYCSAGN